MCGRYIRKPSKKKIAETFHVEHDVEHIPLPGDELNITPYSTQPIIRENRDGRREMALLRWGMVPFRTVDIDKLKGRNLFNARAETIATTAAWREPFKKRRCLVPASGFYEWDKITGSNNAYTFTLTDGSLFALAGIWDAWKDTRGEWLHSFAIVTTEPNEVMGRIHPRMPVILYSRDCDRWLSVVRLNVRRSSCSGPMSPRGWTWSKVTASCRSFRLGSTLSPPLCSSFGAGMPRRTT